jgi:sugar lactone lactonase YvrE
MLAMSCGSGGEKANEAEATAEVAALPSWTWDSTLVFPADRSLARPEDGVVLPDGRLIVADQITGLRLVESDGTSKPFGDLPAAGYTHRPPAHNGGANGISLEPDGAHLLVADVFGAAIYRVDVASGTTEKIYQHRYGINTAVRDSKGAIWFTQSAHNTPEAGEPRLWESVDIQRAEGALYRLPSRDGRLAAEAELVVDSLWFANGLAIDEAAGQLYLAETTGGRVLRYRVDLGPGQGERAHGLPGQHRGGQPRAGRRGPFVGGVAALQRSAGRDHGHRRAPLGVPVPDTGAGQRGPGVRPSGTGGGLAHGAVHPGRLGAAAGADHRCDRLAARRTGVPHRTGQCPGQAVPVNDAVSPEPR